MPVVNLKNTTAGKLEFSFGDSIPASSTEDFDHLPLELLARSGDLITAITSGDVVVNDGIEDLAPADGVDYLKGRFVRASKVVSEGLTAKDDQGNNLIEADKTTGQVKINNMVWPSADGVSGQTLSTDGEGNIVFVNSIIGNLTNPQPFDMLFYENGSWVNLPRNRIKQKIVKHSGNSFLPSNASPTITSGTQVASINFTCKRSTSEVDISVVLQMATNEKQQSGFGFAVFRDSVLIGGAVYSSRDQGNLTKSATLSASITDIPADTIQHTYSIRCGSFTGLDNHIWSCGTSLDTDWGNALENSNSVIIEEIYK